MKSLEETLKYRNKKITDNLTKFYFRFSPQEVEGLFDEMLKWLWLCATAYNERRAGLPNVPKRLNIQSGMLVLDQIWHVFVFHTKDYAEFCQEFFCEFVHHSPANNAYIPPTEEESRIQLSYIYDKLGQDTLIKWYETYSEIYSVENIRARQIPFEVFFDEN
jgi:hypothetical protein